MGVAHAGEPPIDGRVRRVDRRAAALAVPRAILWLPRMLIKGLSYPIGAAVNFDEKHQFYNRVMRAITSEDGLIGVRLAFEASLDLRPIAGLSFFDYRITGPETQLKLEALTGGLDLVVARAHFRPFRPHRLQLDLDTGYVRRNDQIFNGIASITPPDVELVRTRFALESFDFAARLRVRPKAQFSLGLLTQFGLRRFGDGRPYNHQPSLSGPYCLRINGLCVGTKPDERLVPGFAEGTQFVRVGAGLRLDTRQSQSKPHGGVLLQADGAYSVGLGDPSTYFQVAGSATGIINLYHGTHLLVLRLQSQMVIPTGNEIVPFSELVTLGGPDNLRGFAWQRFRDFTSVIASAEYRWTIWMWAEGMLFADYGGTFGQSFKNFGTDGLYPDVGVGIRVRTSSKVFMRLQFAYGFPDGPQLYFVTTAGP